MSAFTLLPTTTTQLTSSLLHAGRFALRGLWKREYPTANRATDRLDRIMAPYRQPSNSVVARLERIMAPYRLAA